MFVDLSDEVLPAMSHADMLAIFAGRVPHAQRHERPAEYSRWVAARNGLALSFTRFVIDLARPYAHHADLEDLVKAGQTGFLAACETFDPSLGYRLSTWAHWSVKREIQESLPGLASFPVTINANGWRSILSPARRRHSSPGVLDAIDRALNFKGGSSVALEDIEEIDKCPLDPEGESDDVTPFNIVALREAIEGHLDSREADVIRMKYESDMTLGMIGEQLGLSKERIRQIQNKATLKLRRALEPQLA